MSEGDAAPVVYIDIELGRTGQIATWVLPELGSRYRAIRELLGEPGRISQRGIPNRPEPAPGEPG